MSRLGRAITPRAPLVLLGWEPPSGAGPEACAELMVHEWSVIEPTVRRCTALVLSGAEPGLPVLARAADRAGIPFFVQVRSWHPPFIPDWSNPRRGWHSETMPLQRVRDWYRDLPGMVGVQAVELNCFGLSGEERRYVEALVEMSAAAGGLLSWQEANDGCNVWIEVGCDRDLYRCLERNPAVVLPQWEMNVPKSMYLCHDSLIGLWLAGAVEQWGVEPQSWYWMEAGYTGLNRTAGECDRGYRAGDRLRCPDGLWAQMILLGASSGATVYSIEPYLDVVVTADRSGFASPWRRAIEPLLRWLIGEGAIPDREQVRRRVPVAYYADFEAASFAERSDVDLYRGPRPDDARAGAHTPRGSGSGALYAGTYGVRHEFEMIPNSGRYYWIPVMPKYSPTDALLAFPAVVTPNALGGEAEVRRFFDARCPDGGRGEAWVADVAASAFVSQTHENLDVPERYRATLPGGRWTVEGDVRAHQYLAMHAEGGDLSVHAGNYEGRESRFTVRGPGALDMAGGPGQAGGAATAVPSGADGVCVTLRHGGAYDVHLHTRVP